MFNITKLFIVDIEKGLEWIYEQWCYTNTIPFNNRASLAYELFYLLFYGLNKLHGILVIAKLIEMSRTAEGRNIQRRLILTTNASDRALIYAWT